jgi:hypothetical protein
MTIYYPPFPKSLDAKDWFEWKNTLMTLSRDEFISRHPWFDYKKQTIYKQLNALCNIPKVYIVSNAREDLIKFLKLANGQFILKKTIGHSSKEVLVLTSLGDGKFQCFLTKSKKEISEICDWLGSSEWLLEESLSCFEELIPMDFKCYVVNGRVRSVGVINRVGAATLLTYFDAETFEQIPFNKIFSEIPNIWVEGFGPYSASLKERITVAINEAERIAKNHLNISNIFISLDMFVTRNEQGYTPWLGEITPRPGAVFNNWLKSDFVISLFDGMSN